MQDPTTPGRFWIAGADGVFRVDGVGAGFAEFGTFTDVHALSVYVAAGGAVTMLAVAGDPATLHRSDNGGASWTDITAQLPTEVGTVGQPLVLDGTTALLGTSTGVYRTANGGQIWTPVHPGAVVGAPVQAAASGSISWLLAAGGVLRSTTAAGLAWTPTGSIMPSVPSLVPLSGGRLLLVGIPNLIVSPDQGANWSPFGPTPPYPVAGVTHSAAGKGDVHLVVHVREQRHPAARRHVIFPDPVVVR